MKRVLILLGAVLGLLVLGGWWCLGPSGDSADSAPKAPPEREPVSAPVPSDESTVRVHAVGAPRPTAVVVHPGGEAHSLSPVPGDDQTGTVRLSGVPAETEVRIVAERFFPATVRVPGPGLESSVTLLAMATLTVGGGENRPADLTLRLEDREGTVAESVFATGRAVFEELGAGDYSLTVLGEDRDAITTVSVTLEWGEAGRIDLGDLRPEVAAAGIVVDRSGRGIAGARVTSRRVRSGSDREQETYETRTDAEGRFELLLPAGCGYEIVAEGERTALIEAAVVLKLTEAVRDLRIVLGQSGGLSGFVLSAEGDPLEDASVEVAPVVESGSTRPWSVSTDGDGRFRIDEAPSEQPLVVTVSREGYSSEVIDRVVRSPDEPPLRVILSREEALVVRVLDAGRGDPIEGADLSVAVLTDRGERRFVLAVDSVQPGEFRVAGWSGSRPIEVVARAEGFEQRRVAVPPGRPGTLDITLEPESGVTVRGIVVGRSGRPIKGITVLARQYCGADRRESYRVHRARSRADGTFLMRGLLPRRRYRYSGHPYGINKLAVIPAVLSAEAGVEVRLTALRGGSFSFRLEPEEGEEIVLPRVRMNAVRLADGRTIPPQVALFDIQGLSFRRSGLAPGEYSFSVFSSSHAPFHSENFRVQEGRSSRIGTIQLKRGAEIRIHLTGDDGSPAHRVGTFALGAGGTVRTIGSIGKDGWVERTLSAGGYHILAQGEGRPALLLGRVELSAGTSQTITHALGGEGKLVVRVSSADGLPRPGVPVEVRAAVDPPLDLVLVNGLRSNFWWEMAPEPPERLWENRELYTDATGRVELSDLQPGDYRVRIGEAVQTVTVPREGAGEVEFLLR